MIYIFGPCQLSSDRYEFYSAGRSVKIRVRLMEILLYLIRNRHRVVTYDELLESVWSGYMISQATIHNCIKEIRNAIGDDGNNQEMIKTIPTRGYRFVAIVSEQDEEGLTPEEQLIEDQSAKARQDKVLIAGRDFIDALEQYDLQQESLDAGLSHELHTLILKIEHLLNNLIPEGADRAQAKTMAR